MQLALSMGQAWRACAGHLQPPVVLQKVIGVAPRAAASSPSRPRSPYRKNSENWMMPSLSETTIASELVLSTASASTEGEINSGHLPLPRSHLESQALIGDQR